MTHGKRSIPNFYLQLYKTLHKNWFHDIIVLMALTPKEKAKIMEKFKLHEKDTGSAEIQVALLTEEIVRLTAHLKTHAKDLHSRRGLLGMVARRKKFLDYLKETNTRKYNAVIKKLGLKR